MSLGSLLSNLNTLHNLKHKVTVMTGELKTDILKFRNSHFLNAAMAGSALISLADGTISSEEKQKMIKFIESNDVLSVFPTTEVITAFQNFVAPLEFDKDIGEAKAYSALAKVKTNTEEARLVMRMILAIAASDGHVDDNEKVVAVQIAKELNLEPTEFGLSA